MYSILILVFIIEIITQYKTNIDTDFLMNKIIKTYSYCHILIHAFHFRIQIQYSGYKVSIQLTYGAARAIVCSGTIVIESHDSQFDSANYQFVSLDESQMTLNLTIHERISTVSYH